MCRDMQAQIPAQLVRIRQSSSTVSVTSETLVELYCGILIRLDVLLMKQRQ